MTDGPLTAPESGFPPADPFGTLPAVAPSDAAGTGTLPPLSQPPSSRRRAFGGLSVGADRRVPVRPLVIAGLLLVTSFLTVNYAIDAARQSRNEARQLAVVISQTDSLSDLRRFVQGTNSAMLFRRASSIGAADYVTLRTALAALPEDPEIDGLRAQAATVVPSLARILAAVEADDLDEARRVGQTELRPTLAALQRDSRQISQARLDRADRVESIARIASGLALIGGSLGLSMVGLSFSRLRQRALLDRTRAEAEERSSTRLDALVNHATDAVTVVDADGRIAWISSTPAFPLARSPQQVIGHFFTDLVHPADRKRAAQAFAALAASSSGDTTTQLRLATAKGAPRPVEVRGENRLDDPAINGVILTIHDVSERTLLEDQLERLASRDPVTGVANRAQLEAHLQSAVARRDRRGGLVGLLLVDLDDFRAVSDTLGHDAGDELLRHAARQLEQSAGEGDLVARLDGDTFAILLDDLGSVSDGQRHATQLLEGLRGRAAVSGGHAVDLDAHGGLAFGAVELTPRELIRHADIALLEAKSQGVKHVVSFTDQMRNKVTERVALTGDLRRATERDEFEVDYQPIVDLATGRTIAVEALARWTHPHRGRLGPASFVDLAEQTGLIRPLGELILRQACRDIAAVLARDPDALRYVSVNISPKQLEDPDLTEVVIAALADAGLPPARLMLELTEQTISTDPERLIQRLVELRQLGIRIALDDFGSGYSFMSFLEDYPLDALKIDRSLAKSMAERTDAALLLSGIVEISRASGMTVIVEGVETVAQRDKARELGIELGQGFLFSRPTTLRQLELL